EGYASHFERDIQNPLGFGVDVSGVWVGRDQAKPSKDDPMLPRLVICCRLDSRLWNRKNLWMVSKKLCTEPCDKCGVGQWVTTRLIHPHCSGPSSGLLSKSGGMQWQGSDASLKRSSRSCGRSIFWYRRGKPWRTQSARSA